MPSEKVLQLAEQVEQLSPDGQALVMKVLDMCVSVDRKVNEDEIRIMWCVEDVKSIAEDLTDEECRKVLQYAKNKHDAQIGINWDVLEEWVRIVRAERDEEE